MQKELNAWPYILSLFVNKQKTFMGLNWCWMQWHWYNLHCFKNSKVYQYNAKVTRLFEKVMCVFAKIRVYSRNFRVYSRTFCFISQMLRVLLRMLHVICKGFMFICECFDLICKTTLLFQPTKISSMGFRSLVCCRPCSRSFCSKQLTVTPDWVNIVFQKLTS